jgi:hypothetical protein
MGAANTTLVIIRREIGGDKKELLSNCNEKRSRRNTKEPSTKSKLGLQACCKQPQRWWKKVHFSRHNRTEVHVELYRRRLYQLHELHSQNRENPGHPWLNLWSEIDPSSFEDTFTRTSPINIGRSEFVVCAVALLYKGFGAQAHLPISLLSYCRHDEGFLLVEACCKHHLVVAFSLSCWLCHHNKWSFYLYSTRRRCRQIQEQIEPGWT